LSDADIGSLLLARELGERTDINSTVQTSEQNGFVSALSEYLFLLLPLVLWTGTDIAIETTHLGEWTGEAASTSSAFTFDADIEVRVGFFDAGDSSPSVESTFLLFSKPTSGQVSSTKRQLLFRPNYCQKGASSWLPPWSC
jgi:hypothetical protein